MNSIGVFVARMQPLHKSHEFLINESIKQNKKTYVFMSSADKARTIRNPFTIDERIGLFRKVFSKELINGEVILIPLDDLTDENDIKNDKVWGKYLYDRITNVIGEDTFSIYYSDEPKIMLNWFTEDLKEKIYFHFYDRNEIFSKLSATKIREALLNVENTKNIQYLAENLPEPIFAIKDCLSNIVQEVYKSNKNHAL